MGGGVWQGAFTGQKWGGDLNPFHIYNFDEITQKRQRGTLGNPFTRLADCPIGVRQFAGDKWRFRQEGTSHASLT